MKQLIVIKMSFSKLNFYDFYIFDSKYYLRIINFVLNDTFNKLYKYIKPIFDFIKVCKIEDKANQVYDD